MYPKSFMISASNAEIAIVCHMVGTMPDSWLSFYYEKKKTDINDH